MFKTPFRTPQGHRPKIFANPHDVAGFSPKNDKKFRKPRAFGTRTSTFGRVRPPKVGVPSPQKFGNNLGKIGPLTLSSPLVSRVSLLVLPLPKCRMGRSEVGVSGEEFRARVVRSSEGVFGNSAPKMTPKETF